MLTDVFSLCYHQLTAVDLDPEKELKDRGFLDLSQAYIRCFFFLSETCFYSGNVVLQIIFCHHSIETQEIIICVCVCAHT